MARPTGTPPRRQGTPSSGSTRPGSAAPPANRGGQTARQTAAPGGRRAAADRSWAEGGPLRVRLTPSLVLLGIAVGVAGAFIAWGLLSRDAEQVPMLASGLLVMGIVLALAAAVAARDTYRAARAGYAGRAFVLALVGGSLAVAAAVSTAGASILAMIWVS